MNEKPPKKSFSTPKCIHPKNEITSYVKSVSKLIVANIGGTEYGPAASFRDIAKAITKNTNEILSIATLLNFEEIPETAFVGIPAQLGRSLGASLYGDLCSQEKDGIKEAAKAIYQRIKLQLTV